MGVRLEAAVIHEFCAVHVGDPPAPWHTKPMTTARLDLLCDLNEHARGCEVASRTTTKSSGMSPRHEASPRNEPTIAAVHEAAHERLARRYGCEVLACFVYPDGRRGATFFEPPLWRLEGDSSIRDPLGQIRARAATVMAGPAAEALWEGWQAPDAEALLLSELTDSPEVPNELDRFFRMTLVAFKPTRELNVGTARRALNCGSTWLAAMLNGTRQRVLDVLQDEWPHVLARARELDRSARRQAA
jgi:hypothetical protein